MSRIVSLLGVILVLAGGMLMWPLARTYWRYSQTTGEIIDVFPVPVGSDQVRLQLVFEFRIRSKNDKLSIYGYSQADSQYRRVEDPVVDKSRVPALTRQLVGEDPRFRIRRRVFYEASDPEGTAFIVVDGITETSHRYEVGMAAAVSGLLCLMFARRRRSHE
ncbi:MAG: hypothetical protein H0W83_01950 [Planctomycetes bacterium]|nr:hypothetical protein [Planctomycetota bacterium]